MVSLEQHAAPYSLKNVFDFFFVFEQMLSLGDLPCFCDLPPAKPTFLLSTMWSGRRRGCFVFGGSLKTSLFPSKSDAQVRGVTGHMLSSTLPDSSNPLLHIHCCLFLCKMMYLKVCSASDHLGDCFMTAAFYFFFNCINLYILNVALGYTASVLGLHVSVFEGLLCSFIVKIDLIRQNLPT